MTRILRRIVILVPLVAMPLAAWGQDRPPWGGWGPHPMWTWGPGGIGMMLMMVGLWALVIAGIVLGIRWLVSERRERRPDRALELLRERYARGEIDRTEFEARRRDLDAA